ncbi:MAG: glycosyltransferase [Acidimicrobiia bacterium]
MASGPHPGEPGDEALEVQLAAERAAAEHWRRVARQRADEYAALRHRTVVRGVLAVEARTAALRRRAAASARRLRAAGAQAAVVAEGLAARLRRTEPLPTTPPPPSDEGPGAPSERARSIVLAVVGSGPADGPLVASAAAVLAVPSAGELPSALARELAAVDPALVAIVLGTTEGLGPVELARLAAAVDGDVVAAGPQVVHPRRPLAQATAHDGRVRAAGLALALDADGAPEVWATGAGQPLASSLRHRIDRDELTGPGVVDVHAVSAAVVVLDARAYRAVGGLQAGDDLDVAVVELCARLRSAGGSVALVPDVVVADHRPVPSRRALHQPIDPAGPAWAAALDRSGAALRRAAAPAPTDHLEVVITTAAPSAKVAARWGDWHLAEGLAGGLRRLGHSVRLQTADQVDDPAGRAADVRLVVRGLRAVRRTPGQRHVLWIVSHPEAIDDDELHVADLVLVASPAFADHLRTRTTTPVDVLLQATDHRRFRPLPVDPVHRHDVTIVAKTREAPRPVVADAVAAGLRPSIYGSGWEGLVDPALVVADHVDNAELPAVYASAGVVLNDHWRTMQAWGFVSNRLFDVLACGTPVISDRVAGIAELFEGAVATYEGPAELRALVDAALDDPVTARARAAAGRALVLARHTFDHRARELLAALSKYAKDA